MVGNGKKGLAESLTFNHEPITENSICDNQIFLLKSNSEKLDSNFISDVGLFKNSLEKYPPQKPLIDLIKNE